MEGIQLLSDSFIEASCNFNELIERLRQGFSTSSIQVPLRHHHDYPNPEEDKDSTLLLMPAFESGKDLGVKIVTVVLTMANTIYLLYKELICISMAIKET